jgi:Ca-activated chloride channel family protein
VKTFLGLAAVVALAVAVGPAMLRHRAQGPTFSAKSELVVLHVLVKDRHGAYVGGLQERAFRVYEEQQPRPIKFFLTEDAPVTIGLLIDSSGSMAPVRDRVIAASTAFVESSNPSDEVFVLVFDDRVRSVLEPSAPFTGDARVLRRALTNVFQPAGRTALYDAIDSGLRYVRRGSRDRHALVVLSDGADNASHVGFAATVAATQASNAIVYTVALVAASDTSADPGSLARFADTSGGAAFEPDDIAGVDRAFQQISRDLRHRYTIGYERAAGSRPGFHRIRVDVRGPDGRKLVTRTREGYDASS